MVDLVVITSLAFGVGLTAMAIALIYSFFQLLSWETLTLSVHTLQHRVIALLSKKKKPADRKVLRR